MKNKKVLVTGSAGFIAPHVIKKFLEEKYEVIGIDILETNNKLQDVKYIRGDLRELAPHALNGVDIIIHLAFVTNIPNSVSNPVVTTYDNIDMTVRLLKLASDNGVKRVVFPSTASLFGNNPIPWVETMPPCPIEPYSWQKLSCEYLLKMWSSRYKLETVSLRFYQIFGENQREDTALAAFIRSRISGKPITLTETTAQSSFRTARRDFVYVGDVAEAMFLAANSDNVGAGEVLNVGSGKATEIGDIAATIGGEVIFIPRRSYEVECHLADTTLTKKLIGWTYKVEVLDWLEKFIKIRIQESNANNRK